MLPRAMTIEQQILKYLLKQPNRTASINQLIGAAGKEYSPKTIIHILQCMIEWKGLDVKASKGIEENYTWGRRKVGTEK